MEHISRIFFLAKNRQKFGKRKRLMESYHGREIFLGISRTGKDNFASGFKNLTDLRDIGVIRLGLPYRSHGAYHLFALFLDTIMLFFGNCEDV